MVEKYNTEQLVERWEDRREIKNLAGIYSQCLLLKKEDEIFDTLWAHREDVCLGVNDGWYSGAEAIRSYYASISTATAKKGKVLQSIFPKELGDKTDEELYGVGPLDIKSLNNYIIEIAGDRQTAKLFCVCVGMVTDVDTRGPISNWVYSYWCMDLVNENNSWKLWHFKELTEIFEPQGTKWASSQPKNFPELDEFASLADITYAKPNVPCQLHEKYHGMRPFTPAPPLPRPYETFSETFTYGMEGAAE